MVNKLTYSSRDPVVGAFHAEGVSHLLPGPELDREVPSRLGHRLLPQLPGPDLAQVPEAATLPDSPGFEAEGEALR